MIDLNRIRTNPPVHANFFGKKRININFKLLKQKRDGELDKGGEKKWNSDFWKESKAQLLEESNNKCAYCETPTRVVAYGDVEHFRPKSIYWWLAYSYENYLPSCTACNQEYKKDYFELEDPTGRLTGPVITAAMTDADLKALAPGLTVDPIDDAAGRRLQDFKNEIRWEKALILNPYFDIPSTYLAYLPILENKEIVVVPTKTRYKKIVKACEDLFGINRKELMDLRFQWYCHYMAFRQTLEKENLSDQTKITLENRIADMRSEKSPYTGMILYFENLDFDELPWDPNIKIFNPMF